jgi:hypothetical protein
MSEVFLLGAVVALPLTFWLVHEILLELNGWKGTLVIYVFAYAFARLWIDLIKFLRRNGIVEMRREGSIER